MIHCINYYFLHNYIWHVKPILHNTNHNNLSFKKKLVYVFQHGVFFQVFLIIVHLLVSQSLQHLFSYILCCVYMQGWRRKGNWCYKITDQEQTFEDAVKGYYCRSPLVTVENRYVKNFSDQYWSEKAMTVNVDNLVFMHFVGKG